MQGGAPGTHPQDGCRCEAYLVRTSQRRASAPIRLRRTDGPFQQPGERPRYVQVHLARAVDYLWRVVKVFLPGDRPFAHSAAARMSPIASSASRVRPRAAATYMDCVRSLPVMGSRSSWAPKPAGRSILQAKQPPLSFKAKVAGLSSHPRGYGALTAKETPPVRACKNLLGEGWRPCYEIRSSAVLLVVARRTPRNPNGNFRTPDMCPEAIAHAERAKRCA